MGEAMSVTEARGALSEIVNRVAYRGERIVLERRGKYVAALVSVEDLAALQALEDRRDVAAARKALREPGRKSLGEIKKALGLETRAKKTRAKKSRAKKSRPKTKRSKKSK